MDDPYAYPGTDILINLLDIRDALELARFEADLTAIRLAELDILPLRGTFDRAQLSAIHRYIFQDVYSWAGELRTVAIAKGNSLFALPAYLAPMADKLFDELRSERYLVGLPKDRLVERLAYYLGELNALHPFREGNGRTQREFIRQLALNASFHVAWEQATREEMTQASIEAMAGRTRLLEVIVRRITTARAE